MAGYTKLFADIVDSSIWERDAETCKVWVTLLALSNADGYVRGSVGWLAGKAKVSVSKCQQAVEDFSKPDPQSRTPDNDGRRIEILPDGWLILNYLIYRDRLSSDPEAIATRERVRKHRERYRALRNAESVTDRYKRYTASASPSASASVPVEEKGCGEKGKVPDLRQLALPRNLAEVESWAELDGLPKAQAANFFNHFEASGWVDRNGNAVVNARSKFKSWCSHEAEKNHKVLSQMTPEEKRRHFTLK